MVNCLIWITRAEGSGGNEIHFKLANLQNYSNNIRAEHTHIIYYTDPSGGRCLKRNCVKRMDEILLNKFGYRENIISCLRSKLIFQFSCMCVRACVCSFDMIINPCRGARVRNSHKIWVASIPKLSRFIDPQIFI